MHDWEKELGKELESLRRFYVSILPQRLKEIQDVVRACLAAPGSPEDLIRLRNMAHKLRGSAGSYGFGHISRTAEDLEEWLKRSQNLSFHDPVVLEEFRTRVQSLSEEMANPRIAD